MKRLVFALAAMSMIGGCGVFKSSKPKTPTIGERIPVLSSELRIEVDPVLADIAVVIPPAEANADWAQPGGNPAKSMGHLALGTSLGRAWSVKIGAGSFSDSFKFCGSLCPQISPVA